MARKSSKSVRFPHVVLNIVFEGPRSPEGFVIIRGYLGMLDDAANLRYRERSEGRHLYGIVFRAQSDQEHLTREGAGPHNAMYSNDVLWSGDSTFGISRADARRALEALNEIEKGMGKIEAIAGPVASFGAWVYRLCQAIGIDNVRFRPERDDAVPTAIDTASYRIDHQIRQWIGQARERAGLTVLD